MTSFRRHLLSSETLPWTPLKSSASWWKAPGETHWRRRCLITDEVKARRRSPGTKQHAAYITMARAAAPMASRLAEAMTREALLFFPVDAGEEAEGAWEVADGPPERVLVNSAAASLEHE
jgi:hypothetical protein